MTSGLHHIPPVGIRDDLGDVSNAVSTTSEDLLHVLRVEDGSTALDADSLLEVLHTHVAVVAVVGEIGIGILPRDITYREREATHELIDVVEAQCTPSIILTGLHDDIGILECSTEERLDEAPPVLPAYRCRRHPYYSDRHQRSPSLAPTCLQR